MSASMKLLGITAKWEWRRWLINTAMPCGVFLLITWILLLLTPAPQPHWHSFFRTAAIVVVTLASIAVALNVIFLTLAYPFAMSFRDSQVTALSEHLPGNPYIYRLSVRLCINIITAAIGIGVFWATMIILQRFEAANIGWLTSIYVESHDAVRLISLVHMFVFGLPLAFLSVAKIDYLSGLRVKRSAESVCFSTGGFVASVAMMWLHSNMLSQSPPVIEKIIAGFGSAILIVAAAILISRKFDKTLEV